MVDTIIITHGIKGLPYHFFCGNDLLQISHCPDKRTKPQKFLKKQKNGLCRGYFIDRKFKSLSWLERRKYPVIRVLVKEEPMPF